MLEHTVTNRLQRLVREGLDAGTQKSALPALPGEWDRIPLGHPSPPQEAVTARAQLGVWVDSAKEKGRRPLETAQSTRGECKVPFSLLSVLLINKNDKIISFYQIKIDIYLSVIIY